jgi:hypothetical protein
MIQPHLGIRPEIDNQTQFITNTPQFNLMTAVIRLNCRDKTIK